MVVNAIQTNEYQPKQASYLGAVGIGALSGYALKNALPITKQEKDDLYWSYIEASRIKAKLFKDQEIEAIKAFAKKNSAEDKFIKFIEETDAESKSTIFKSLKGNTKTEFFKLVSHVNEVARDVKYEGKKVAAAVAKDIRPAGTFIASGAVFALAGTLVYNVIQRVSAKPN